MACHTEHAECTPHTEHSLSAKHLSLFLNTRSHVSQAYIADDELGFLDSPASTSRMQRLQVVSSGLVYAVLGIKSRTLCTLGKPLTKDLHLPVHKLHWVYHLAFVRIRSEVAHAGLELTMKLKLVFI